MKKMPLDRAFENFTANQDQVSFAAYYVELMASELYVPISERALTRSVDGRAGEEPMEMKAFRDEDGTATILALDTEQRLTDWAAGREQPFAALDAEALFLALEGKQQIALNLGSNAVNLISLAETKWIYDQLKSNPSTHGMAVGTEVSIGVPADIPDGLANALKSAFKGSDNVEAGYIFGMEDDSDAGGYRLVIGVLPAGKDPETTENIIASVRQAIDDLSRADLPVIDFLILRDGDVIADNVKQAIDPFYPGA